MTGYFSATIRDHIEILSDRAVYDAKGVLQGTATKVHALDGRPVAVMSRGWVIEGERMQSLVLELFRSSDTIDAGLAAVRNMLLVRREMDEDVALEVVFWCISETEGPLHCVFTTYDSFVDSSRKAYSLITSPVGLVQGDPLQCGKLQFATLADKALPLMTPLREWKGAIDRTFVDGKVMTVPPIGGGIDHTILTMAGATTKHLHDFPDLVGEVIGSRDTAAPASGFVGSPEPPQGTPALVPAIVRLGIEFENIPQSRRTAEEVRHIRLAGDLVSRVRGLEFYRTITAKGAEFDLVSTCCNVPVKQVPADGEEHVTCADCGREHGLARHVEAVGAWLIVEDRRKKRPLNRHQRRSVELELARR